MTASRLEQVRASRGGCGVEPGAGAGEAPREPMIETMPLGRAADACGRMMSGAARFRMVMTTVH